MTNINVTILKQYNSQLNEEYNNFTLSTYSTFLNSYIKSSNNTYIKLISSKLSKMYKKIDNDYKELNKWFESYITNIDALEKYLSGDSGYSKISEDSVRNFVHRKLNDVISEDNNAYNRIDRVPNRKEEKSVNNLDFEEFKI